MVWRVIIFYFWIHRHSLLHFSIKHQLGSGQLRRDSVANNVQFSPPLHLKKLNVLLTNHVLAMQILLRHCLGKTYTHQLLVTPWTAAYQAPLSMGFSRQEYWSGMPLPSPLRVVVSSLLPWTAYLLLGSNAKEINIRFHCSVAAGKGQISR